MIMSRLMIKISTFYKIYINIMGVLNYDCVIELSDFTIRLLVVDNP